MRKVLFVLLAAFLMIGCNKEKAMKESDIPTEITTYVKQYFPDNPIIKVIEDKDDLSISYDVFLESGFNLEFNSKKEVTSIESTTRQRLPDSVLQTGIINRIQNFCPKNFAVKWEKEDNVQKVELDSRLTLEFDMEGNFIRVDA